MRIVWSLAWPAIMTFGLESLVGLIDALMVGRLGASAVAGVGVGTQILHAVSVMNMALATGTVALVARHVGANERAVAEAVVPQALYVAVAMALAHCRAGGDLGPTPGVDLQGGRRRARRRHRLRSHDHARRPVDGRRSR